MADTDAFFTPPPTRDYTLSDPSQDGERRLTFPTRCHTASREQHGVVPLVSKPPRRQGAPRAAVLVLPQWNSDANGHVGLVPAAHLERPQRAAPQPAVSRSAHAARTPSRRLHRQRQRRADGAGVPAGRARCAARHRVACGCRATSASASSASSLGSCLALLTAAHEPLIRAEALNHISPYFADVVWRGLSTEHVREGLDGHIELEHAARALETHQPALVPRSVARSSHAPRVRAIRFDVSRRSVQGSGTGVPRTPRRARARRAPVRPLLAPARRRSSISTDSSSRAS